MKTKKIIAFTVVAFMFFNLPQSVFAENAQSWYCVRNKEHKQAVVGSDISWIENYGGYYIDHEHNDTSKEKVIYLTFDAGYENGYVSKILDVLHEKQVSGAFFILEHIVQENTDLVIRMGDEGHLVCNHTASHVDVTTLDDFNAFENEIKSLENVYAEKTGRQLSKYFRPPEGRFDRKTLEYAQKIGYKTVFWSFAYADWDNGAQMNAEAAKKKILENIHNGAVILLHPTSKTNAEILGEVIDELKSDGYTFGRLDDFTDS